ncbi:TetR/AcrR family transcriptional regulator [Nocardioides euryhalodurans]|uniref:TetR/AcrR family transcriptional regulator n=1 Tax=Nocardioides euryhalodurans TaxID=2518370 RepID=A0A4P7GLW6_9ACTN|nr:TetR/AcrR family transcriptional regulator [Nocardioides euryhalodurans]QBR92737.1 TetR/AcrR family transcriptional regulator [Nocardioides euryhalodurans]
MAVKGTSGHRQRQAEATKLEVARVARALFAEHGYVATTISRISAEADIPVQTIYSAFGSKAKILDKITELWMAEAETTARAAAYLEEADPARQLRLLAELNRRQMQAGSDVVAIYQEAAASDPQMADTLRNVLAAREREVRRLIEAVAPRLRPELTVDSALDVTLALTLPEVFHLLVAERGWSHRRYETWLAASLVGQLLRD